MTRIIIREFSKRTRLGIVLEAEARLQLQVLPSIKGLGLATAKAAAWGLTKVTWGRERGNEVKKAKTKKVRGDSA